ncbi:MAG: hypothetical protein ACI86H_001149 [bacterium]|jgi:hypothetical protein
MGMLNKLVVGVSLLALVGCAPSKPLECGFPDSPERPAPRWVCDMPVDGVDVSAVGSHPYNAATPVSFQKQMAVAKARTTLAQQMKVHVKNLIKQYMATTGTGKNVSVDSMNSSVTKQVTSATLVGSRPFRTITNPDTKTLYVLVGLSPALAAKASKQALNSSYKNDKALWQKFLAKKADNELDKEISKISAGSGGAAQ